MSNISAISWEEQVTFDEIILMTAFAFILDFYSASTFKQVSGRHVTSL